MTERKPLEYVNIADAPAGTKGMVMQVTWAVDSEPVGGPYAGGGYIEGCWSFYRQENEAFPGLIVGTGVEDYFDSGFYFGADGGVTDGLPWTNEDAGMPFFQRNDSTHERISAYRFHLADPLVFSDGGRLVWRVGAQGS